MSIFLYLSFLYLFIHLHPQFHLLSSFPADHVVSHT